MSFTTLMYHEIRENTTFDPNHPSSIHVKQNYEDILPSLLFVTLENFEEQMTYMKKHQYHTLSLSEVKDYYYHQIALPEKSVLLTFDDCYQSIKKYAYPILKKYGFHATAFVVTSWLHDIAKTFDPTKSICMASDELLEIADVFEYANHTDSFHTRIDRMTSNLMLSEDVEFAQDLDECNRKDYITAKDVFAYPFGLYSEGNVDLLKKKDFKLAFTSESGSNDVETDPLLLKRNAVPHFMDLCDFINLIHS